MVKQIWKLIFWASIVIILCLGFSSTGNCQVESSQSDSKRLFGIEYGLTPKLKEKPLINPPMPVIDTSGWVKFIECFMGANDISCEDIGCVQDEIEVGTFDVVAYIGFQNGYYKYLIQGRQEPLINWHNGYLNYNGSRIPVRLLIGSLTPLNVGQELKFHSL